MRSMASAKDVTDGNRLCRLAIHRNIEALAPREDL